MRRLAVIVLCLVAVALLNAVPAAADPRAGPVELGAAVNDHGFQYGPPGYFETLGRYDAATAESAMKMDALQPERGRFEFAFADAMVDGTRARGLRTHGHTLLWCADEWAPKWLTQRAWEPEELRHAMREHITRVVEHFRGRVDTWDVVNEAWAADGTLRDCVFSRVLGERYVEEAHRLVRALDPGARIIYNEAYADVPNRKFLAMERMARDFLARGVPLDGIGFQMHLLSGRMPDRARIDEAMARMAALGLDVHVSELEVTTSLMSGTTEQRLALQGEIYRLVAEACRDQPACFRVTTWGFTDCYSFRGPSNMALPFDCEYREKPAWRALQEVLRPSVPPPAPTTFPDTPITEQRQPAAASAPAAAARGAAAVVLASAAVVPAPLAGRGSAPREPALVAIALRGGRAVRVRSSRAARVVVVARSGTGTRTRTLARVVVRLRAGRAKVVRLPRRVRRASSFVVAATDPGGRTRRVRVAAR